MRMEPADNKALPTIETFLGEFLKCAQKVIGLDGADALRLVSDCVVQRQILGTRVVHPSWQIEAYGERPGHAAEFPDEGTSPFAHPG
jgi:hypothetical protein